MGKKGKAPITAIRVARLRLKMTQADVAKAAGIACRHYQRIEYWDTIPNVILALRLKNVLESSVEELWGDLLYV